VAVVALAALGSLDDLVELAAVEPDAPALAAVVDLDSLAVGHRKLRSVQGTLHLASFYLQNSVALLPERPETRRGVRKLLDRLRRSGSEARVLPIAISDAAQEGALVEQFRAERSDEYAEVVSRVPAFLEEIAYERGRGRATSAEVEDSEADPRAAAEVARARAATSRRPDGPRPSRRSSAARPS
jgi:hypothetical protein